ESGKGRDAQAAPSEGQQQLMQFLSDGISQGMAPADCAALVFEAIREQRFWVFTHEDFKPEYQRRIDDLMANRNPLYNQYTVDE
ncbi:MAG: hypothetical protein ACI9OO_001980, partial [Bacteroidia bacterium]